jgi:hypothetical protein
VDNVELAGEEGEESPKARGDGVGVRRAFFLACGGILIVSVIAWIVSGLLMDAEPLGSGPTAEIFDRYRNLYRINSAAYHVGVGALVLMAAGYMMDMLGLLWPDSE